MAGAEKVKLFKIASQINIGKDAIVQFLQTKGFEVENKPTFVLSEDMTQAVLDKFQKEAKAAEKQREKVERIIPKVKKSEPEKTKTSSEIPEADYNDAPRGNQPPAPLEERRAEEPISVREPEVKTTKAEPSLNDGNKAPVVEAKDSANIVISPPKNSAPSEIIDANVSNIPSEIKIADVQYDDIPEEDNKFNRIDYNKSAVKSADNRSPRDSRPPRENQGNRDSRPPRENQGARDSRPPRDGQSSNESRPPREGGQRNWENRPPRDGQGSNESRPPREGGQRTWESRPPRDGQSSGESRPPREGGQRNWENRPPRDGQGSNESRPPREGGQRTWESRPPRDGQSSGDSRPPREGGQRNWESRPPRDGQSPGDSRPPREGGQGNRDNRPPRDGQGSRDSRPPREGGQRTWENRPPRDGQSSGDSRPPREGGQRTWENRPPRDGQSSGDSRPPRDGQRTWESRPPRDGQGASEDPNIRRKKKRIGEIEYSSGSAPKLPGLTIVGKIELSADEKNKSKKRGFGPAPVDDDKKKKAARSKTKGKPKFMSKEDIEKEKKKKRKKSMRESISVEEIDKAIRKTLAGMDDSADTASRTKLKQKKRLEREEKEAKKQEAIEIESTILRLTEFVSVSDLAGLINISPSEIIMKCMNLGLMVSINQRLDKDTILLIADDYGLQVEFLDSAEVQLEDDFEDVVEDLSPRPPIVTIMGHVDHGKTSLLDFIRKANVVAGEAGGITQHIGAYRVQLPNGRYISFLDTPGHEAFTAMRARGAQVTDIVILVVAADDSVMPQTVEAISHALAANVPIIVALNKIDKPDAKPDRIRQQLADNGILVEEWGGKYQCVEVSAKKGLNVETLLEKIVLEADMLELKANPDRIARAVVIESHMTTGLGTTVTVMVQKGTLEIGDPFVAGIFSGKVRAMFDERGNKVISAGPSTPVQVIGFDGLPEAGDILAVYTTDAEAKTVSNKRQQLKREQTLRQTRHITLDEISKQILLGGVKNLPLIIKGDVGGSVEALSDSLEKLSRDEVRVQIIHKGVGAITESDVILASASNAVILGFQVSIGAGARKLVEREGVDVRFYDIIYDCINEVQLALEGLLTPEVREDITAQIEVRQLFKISKVGVVAGCMVLSGKITRNDKVRVLRDGLSVYKGSLQSLKRNKDDVKEADAGYECGIMMNNFNDFEIGDVIEVYKTTEVKRTLN